MYRKIKSTLTNKEAYISKNYFVNKGMPSMCIFADKEWISSYELNKELEVLI